MCSKMIDKAIKALIEKEAEEAVSTYFQKVINKLHSAGCERSNEMIQVLLESFDPEGFDEWKF